MVEIAAFVALIAPFFELPLDDENGWLKLEYNRIAANTVSFSPDGMRIGVSNSASPVVYPFDLPKTVKYVSVHGELDGLITLPDNGLQGSKGYDDFSLRLGLVISGTKKLSRFQRVLAPSWVKTLFSFAPKDKGVERIIFLAATQQDALFGTEREHPLSELITEQYEWSLKDDGEFSFEYEFDEPKEVLGIWISSDGDDTQSSYSITYKKITLSVEGK